MGRLRIFLCYRRDDMRWVAGRLYDELRQRYGPEQVFQDITAIRPGIRYTDQIQEEIRRCDVLVVVMGEDWLSATDPQGRRRLDSPRDLVRLEIATALQRSIPIIPVLVQGASMPADVELPDDIADLAFYHACEVTDTRWDYDVGVLLKAIDGLAGESVPAETSDVGEQVKTIRRQQAKREAEREAEEHATQEAESEPTAAEAAHRPTKAKGPIVTSTLAATQSDQPEHSEAPRGEQSDEGAASGGDRLRSPDLVSLLAQRARERGMAVREGETQDTMSFPLVLVDEHPLVASNKLERVASSMYRQPKIRLVYVVAELPASQDVLDRFVSVAWKYTSRGRLFERGGVALICMPVAILPRSELALPKARLHQVGAKVPVLIDIKTHKVSFEMPRRGVYSRQAQELAQSFFAGI
jgi:TIR domain